MPDFGVASAEEVLWEVLGAVLGEVLGEALEEEDAVELLQPNNAVEDTVNIASKSAIFFFIITLPNKIFLAHECFKTRGS